MDSFYIINFVLLILADGFDLTKAQDYNITGSTDSQESGNLYTYTCTTNGRIGVKWTEESIDGTSNVYVYVFSSGTNSCIKSIGTPPPDYTFNCDATGVFTLRFNLTFERHGKSKWKCGNSAAPTPESLTVEPNVTVLLTSVTFDEFTSPVEVGQQVTLTCRTNPCYPVPEIKWQKDGNILTAGTVTQANNYTRTGYVGVSVWSNPSIALTDRGTYSCMASGGTITGTAVLNVFAPTIDCKCQCGPWCTIILVLEIVMFLLILILVVIFIVKSKRETVTVLSKGLIRIVRGLTISTLVGCAVFLVCLIILLVICIPSCTPDCKPDTMCTVQIIAIVFLGLLGIGDFVAAVLLIMKRNLVKKAFKGDAADGSAHTGAGAQPNGNRNGHPTSSPPAHPVTLTGAPDAGSSAHGQQMTSNHTSEKSRSPDSASASQVNTEVNHTSPTVETVVEEDKEKKKKKKKKKKRIGSPKVAHNDYESTNGNQTK